MGELYSAWPRSHIIALTSDSVGDCLNKKKPRLVNLASWKMPFLLPSFGMIIFFKAALTRRLKSFLRFASFVP